MLWSNICFVCGYYFRKSRSIFGYLLIGTVASLAAPILSVYLPRTVVQAVTEGWEFSHLALGVGVLALGIMLLNILSMLSGIKYSQKAFNGRMKMVQQLEEVMVSCKYPLTEDPTWQNKIDLAGDTVFSDSSQRGIAGIVQSLRDFVVNILGIFTFSTILGLLHPAVLVILIFTSLVPGLVAGRMTLYETRQREKWLPCNKQIKYIRNHTTTAEAGKDIRLYDAAGFFLGQMEEAVMKRLVWVKKLALRRLGADGVDTLMMILQNSVALGFTACEIIQGRISIPDFTFYSGSAIQFAQFMNRFVKSYSIVKRCSKDVEILREAYAFMPEKKTVVTLQNPERPAPRIQFDHVSFTYPGSEEPILKDICFQALPGEKLALVGVNGAGKSTLVKLLCGLYQPTSGQILIDGIPTTQWEEGELFGLFSTVFQDMLVLPFSVLENVATTGRADEAKVRRCMEQAGLSQRFPDLNLPLVKGIQDGAENLSGGEEQKLLLARALYKEAPILVLDEPTAALDPLAESELYTKYNEFTQKKTSFFISHRLASTGFCDKILLLGEGRILEEGSHAQLLEQGGLYAHMFHEQSKYYADKEEGKEGGNQ